MSFSATIATWEYGCCGDVPDPGARVEGVLAAYPATADEQSPVDEPFIWDRDLQLLRFDGWSARWDPTRGDPTSVPLALALSWHDRVPGPTVRGIVESCTPEQDWAVTVRVAPDSCDEPSPDTLAAYAEQEERESRTVHITGPATAFGDGAPAEGVPLEVNLDDPALSIERNPAEVRGVVTGVPQQVAVAVTSTSELWTSYHPIEPGYPTASVPHPLMLRFTIDHRFF